MELQAPRGRNPVAQWFSFCLGISFSSLAVRPLYVAWKMRLTVDPPAGGGWVAGHLKRLLDTQGKDVVTTTVRIENREEVMKCVQTWLPWISSS